MTGSSWPIHGFRTELDEFFRLVEAADEPSLRYAALVRRTMLALLAGRLNEAEHLMASAVPSVGGGRGGRDGRPP